MDNSCGYPKPEQVQELPLTIVSTAHRYANQPDLILHMSGSFISEILFPNKIGMEILTSQG